MRLDWVLAFSAAEVIPIDPSTCQRGSQADQNPRFVLFLEIEVWLVPGLFVGLSW